MNKTKKLTTGAMLLAIFGALMLLDRQFSYFFDVYIVMIIPVVIIIYSAMYDIKDGGILSVCLLILTFIIGSGSFNYLCYVPLGIIVGLGYSYFLKRNVSKQVLLLASIVLYTIGEIIIAFIVMPIFGINLAEQVNQLKDVFISSSSTMGLDLSMIDLSTILPLAIVFSTIFMGLIEGFLTHIVTLLLLKKFKIKDIDNRNLVPLEPSLTLTYICIVLVFLMMVSSRYLTTLINNETIKYILLSAGMIGFIILCYFGYIFSIIFLKIRYQKNMALLVILAVFLLFPFSLFVLMIIGFLYGSGPLKKYIIINKK